jgi:photosystem II stability/assembly factor-like uncharacterized protein
VIAVGSTTWTQIGDALGSVTALHVAPDRSIWSGTDEGLLTTSDSNGESWRTLTSGFTEIRTILVDSEGTIYCELYGDGIIRSIDGGNRWTSIGLSNERISTIAVESTGRIHVDEHVSDIDGRDWQRANRPAAESLTVSDDDEVFALGGGLRVTRDVGQTWTEREGLGHGRITITPDGHLFTAQDNDGVYRSTDRGFTCPYVLSVDDWVRSLFSGQDGLLLVGSVPRTGTFRSTGSGDTWQNVTPELQEALRCFAETGNGTLVAGGQDGGLFRSTDGGLSWTQVGDLGDRVNAILFLDGVIVAGGFTGIRLSGDDGLSWTRSGLDHMGIRALTAHVDGFLLAGTNDHGVQRGFLRVTSTE